MEGVSTKVYSGLKGYWKRRGYQKLNGVKVSLPETSNQPRKRKFWKIKLTPKLKIKLNFRQFSIRKLLIKFRDAYVNFMLKAANNRAFGVDYGGATGFGTRPIKEYDEKMIVEIYKSMVINQGKLVARDVTATAKIGPEITVNDTTINNNISNVTS